MYEVKQKITNYVKEITPERDMGHRQTTAAFL
jgi:hypothetical protein